ncbi:MAG TPA: phage portal protein [Vitreimonas sp.]|uniref:phage portal protein n=1 Tax=Vitreimonas sp. TaxID=3069702 RepID=UPI002D5BEA68|nr:phage portal protein [Vitreimonas sp.]HYD87121.1 phage portal protein [Vitreimonas sp.]
MNAVVNAPAPVPAEEKPRVRVKAWTKPNQAHASAYQGAGRAHQSMAGWHPIRASADADLQYEREELVARARDLQRNDGATAAAVIHSADLIVGHRWVLSAKPDYHALGIDKKTSRVLARAMQREFYAWAMDPRKHCDRRRRQTFPGMLTLMAKQWSGPEGEALAVLGFRDEAKRLELGARYSTSLEVIDPDRLSNPMGQPDSDTLRSGVELDEDGAPIAAHIRRAHAIEPGFSSKQYEWERVPWENPGGRPIVLHVMDHDRAAQNRGVTRFAPILTAIKQLAQITDAEAANTLLNALFGAFIKTGYDPKAIADALATGDHETDPWGFRSAFYEIAPLFLNGIRMPVLAPGDEVQMNTSSRTTQPFIDFRAAFLSIVASMTGTSYEQISRDFSRTNYSSSRAALNEVWRTVGGRRAQLGQNAADQTYFAVMQEAFDRGYLTEPAGAPPFEEMPGAYCAATWIGPALGSVDPVKDRQAAQIGIEMGLTTLEKEAAAEGEDYEDNLDQLAYENELRAERGLAPVNPAIYGVTPATDVPAAQPAPASASRAR